MNNIKTFENFNSKDIFKYIKNNDIKSIKNYINSGVDLNIQRLSGYTPLIVASKNNKIEIVKLLLNAGADVNKQNISGNTALMSAALHNNREIVELLLNAGADTDKQNNGGNTALIYASNNVEIIKLLLDAGADIDKQNKYGYTALTLAALYNYHEIVELLLDYGADEFILDNNDKSFYYLLNTENKEYFTQNYPTSVYNAISHNYKKSFIEFVKDFGIKIKK